MTRINEAERKTYRGRLLVVRAVKGKVSGRVYEGPEGGPVLHDLVDAQSTDRAWHHLMAFVDKQNLEKVETAGSSAPSVYQYVAAFQSVLGDIPAGHSRMLHAHLNAPNRTLTATQLATAAGYEGYAAANLQYGLLGQRIWHYAPFKLPAGKDGKPVFTFTLATGAELERVLEQEIRPESSDSAWRWVLRPEVAAALQSLGFEG